MSSFKFPPPPPPPPKATATDPSTAYSSQRGDRGGGRGRGFQGRGRGNNLRGNARGGHTQSADRGGGNGQQRGSSRGGHSRGRGGSYQNANNGAPHNVRPQQADSPSNAFTGSQYGFAGATSTSHPRSDPIKPHYNNKRKRDETALPNNAKQTSAVTVTSTSKPSRQFAKTAPAVPSFGFSATFVPPVVQPVSKPAKPQYSSTRKANLGLVRNGAQQSDSESDVESSDVDEEAEYAMLPASKRMAFEHDGQRISLQTEAELAAWIKDRRKNFPTQEKIHEKAKLEAEKRESELEFLAKVKGKKRDIKEPTPNHAEKAKRQADKEKARAELEKLRAKLHQTMLAKNEGTGMVEPKKPGTLDLGLGYDTESDDEESSVLSDSSVVSSSEESSDDSANNSDAEVDPEANAQDDDSDSPPEAQSSKTPQPSIRVPPPPPPDPVERALQKKKPNVCNQWERSGSCTNGDKCRYAHPRSGIYDRMVEQEMKKSDQLALDAIKWLGKNGFLG